MNRHSLINLITQQCGLFTTLQAQSCGYSQKQVRRRVHIGEWKKVLGKTLVLAGTPITPRIRDRALTLAIQGAVLAGPSAARIYGISTPDNKTYVNVPQSRRIRLPGVVGLRCKLDPREVTRISGTPVTRRGRTIFDCLRILPFADGEALLDRALQQRWTSLSEQTHFLYEHVGTVGQPKARALISQAQLGARSVAERLLISHVQLAGVTGWVANFSLGNAIIDLAFPELKLAIEVDGKAWHSALERFEHDRERQNAIVTAGWQVLRFTWRDLTERPEYVTSTIQAMIRKLSTPQ